MLLLVYHYLNMILLLTSYLLYTVYQEKHVTLTVTKLVGE